MERIPERTHSCKPGAGIAPQTDRAEGGGCKECEDAIMSHTSTSNGGHKLGGDAGGRERQGANDKSEQPLHFPGDEREEDKERGANLEASAQDDVVILFVLPRRKAGSGRPARVGGVGG